MQRISCFPVSCNALTIDKQKYFVIICLRVRLIAETFQVKESTEDAVLHSMLYKLKKHVCQKMSIYAIFMFLFLFPIFY